MMIDVTCAANMAVICQISIILPVQHNNFHHPLVIAGGISDLLLVAIARVFVARL